MLMLSKKLILVGMAGLLLASCASYDEEVAKTISKSNASAESAMAQQNTMRRSGAVVRMSGAKLAGDEVMVKNTSQLPPAFTRSFSYLSAHQPLSAILGEISRRTGVPAAMQPSATVSVAAAAAAALSPAAVPGQPNFSGGPDTPIAVDWNGDLKGLLDYLASTTRMFWKYEDGRIYFFKTETRSFHVYLPAGKRTVNSSIALAGAGSGSAGSNPGTVNVASNMEIDAYDSIIHSVLAIVATAEGGQSATAAGAASSSKNVVSNPSLGLITVTGTPATLDRVASYVRSVNERFAQNVMIGVKIYNLTVNKGVNAGVSLTAVYNNLVSKLGVTLTGTPNMAPAAPMSGATPGSLVIDALVGSKWTGSQLLMQAMEQIGNVQYVTSGQVIAANGQPSPLQVATEYSYISSRTAPVITSTIFTPGTVTTSVRSVGFTGNFLPLILGDNRIMLQYQINLSSLLSLDSVGSGDNAIQIPKVASQSLQQQAFLKDGQSIVLLGFEQEGAQLVKANGMTGISRNAGSDRNLMVIVMEVYSGK